MISFFIFDYLLRERLSFFSSTREAFSLLGRFFFVGEFHSPILGHVTVPCHIIQSTKDLAASVVVAEYLQRNLGGKSIVEVMPMEGHLPQLRSPDIVTPMLINDIRAPELLLGEKQYSTAIEMWSFGGIIAELLFKEPLFNGKTEFDQLDKNFRILGTPNEAIFFYY